MKYKIGVIAVAALIATQLAAFGKEDIRGFKAGVLRSELEAQLTEQKFTCENTIAVVQSCRNGNLELRFRYSTLKPQKVISITTPFAKKAPSKEVARDLGQQFKITLPAVKKYDDGHAVYVWLTEKGNFLRLIEMDTEYLLSIEDDKTLKDENREIQFDKGHAPAPNF